MNNAFEYLKLLWPTAICAMLAAQINRYAVQNRVSSWDMVIFRCYFAYILYKHYCWNDGVRPKDMLAFHLELIHLMLDRTHCHKRHRPSNHQSKEYSPEECRHVQVIDHWCLLDWRGKAVTTVYKPIDLKIDTSQHLPVTVAVYGIVRQTALMSIMKPWFHNNIILHFSHWFGAFFCHDCTDFVLWIWLQHNP